MDIKRYDYLSMAPRPMYESKDGDYVKYSDAKGIIEELKAEIKKFEEQNEHIIKLLKISGGYLIDEKYIAIVNEIANVVQKQEALKDGK